MYKNWYLKTKILTVILITVLGFSVQEAHAYPEINKEKNALPLYKVKGKVSDETGEPLPGVNIVIKGTNIGTITDVDGYFQFNVTKNSKLTITASFIGMKSKDIVIVPDKFTYITLSPEAYALNEVIVTGFQTISRERSTGSAVIVNNEKLNKIQAPDLIAKIEGLTPGLSTYNKKISIRGVSSFSVDATPLLVVDGQPATGIKIDDLNPETIENITVLKDAAATALYGVRASNGVIVVNTKQAQDNKMNVNISLGYYLDPLPSLSYQHYASTSDIIDFEREYLLSNPEYIKSPSAYFSTITGKTNPIHLTQIDQLYYKLSKKEITENELKTSLNALRGNDYRKEYRKKLQQLKLTQDYNISLLKGDRKSVV